MRAGPAIRALALEGVVGAMIAALWWAGPALPTPPLTSWTAASEWYAAAGPEVAMASLIRLGALAVAGWLIVATAAQFVAVVGAPLVVRRIADLIAPRSLQRFVHGLAGVSLSTGLAVVAPGAGTPSAVTGSHLVAAHLVGEPPPGTATLRLVPDVGSPIPDAAPPAAPVPVAPVAPAAVPAPTADTVVVEPGDSLWSIAEETLADAGGGEPDDRAVERYWRRLVDTNRSTLVDPGNPDLIYPGQTVVLPDP